jgi:predicted enzyme related to lactoylglutathione lyase
VSSARRPRRNDAGEFASGARKQTQMRFYRCHLFRVIVPAGHVERPALFYSALLGAAGSRRRRVGTISTAREQYSPATIPRPDGDGHNAKPLPEPIYFAVDDLESIYDKCRDSGASFSSAVVPAGPLGRVAQRAWGERSSMRQIRSAIRCAALAETRFLRARPIMNHENNEAAEDHPMDVDLVEQDEFRAEAHHFSQRE